MQIWLREVYPDGQGVMHVPANSEYPSTQLLHTSSLSQLLHSPTHLVQFPPFPKYPSGHTASHTFPLKLNPGLHVLHPAVDELKQYSQGYVHMAHVKVTVL